MIDGKGQMLRFCFNNLPFTGDSGVMGTGNFASSFSKKLSKHFAEHCSGGYASSIVSNWGVEIVSKFMNPKKDWASAAIFPAKRFQY